MLPASSEELWENAMDDAGASGGMKFAISRRKDTPPLTEEQFYAGATADPGQREHMDKMLASGWADGEETRMVFNGPGFVLVHAWFKPGYPLPLHSHSGDGLYFITAGTLSLGTENLEAGDAFFVPANSAYTYMPGPDGVEVLEFRHSAMIDFRILTKESAGFWAKALQQVAANRDSWKTAKRPSNTPGAQAS
jgi:quercetin dioxygenase-like cupin family protein